MNWSCPGDGRFHFIIWQLPVLETRAAQGIVGSMKNSDADDVIRSKHDLRT
jgi:hypothetical protein